MRAWRPVVLVVWAAFLVSAIVPGCSGGDDDDDENVQGGDFDITVTEGTTPTYSWALGPAFTLDVRRTSDVNTAVWGIQPDPPQLINALDSPVVHGVVPSGYSAVFADEPVLTEGVRYRVVVGYTAGVGSIGFTDFTP